MDVRLNTRLESISDGGLVRLSDGEEFPTETLVWTAGTKPNPMLAETDLPLDGRGRVECEPTLQVAGMPDAWAAGDLAAVPDLTKGEPGATTAPNAQHAVRQAKRLADNIVAVLNGRGAGALPARVRGLGRQPRAAQGRGAGLRA